MFWASEEISGQECFGVSRGETVEALLAFSRRSPEECRHI